MSRVFRWRERYVWYRTANLSVSEHSLICDLLSASKGLAISLIVLFGIGIYAAWGHISAWWIGLFIVAFTVEVMLKITVSERFMNLPTDEQKRPIWRFIYDAGAGYSGVVYGLTGLAMFVPMPDENRILLIGVYGTIVCAFATSTAFFQPIARWVIPALVAPTLIALLASGKAVFWLLGVVMIIGCVGTVYLSCLSQKRYAQVSAINEQNKVLVKELSTQQQVADEQKCLAEQAVIDKSRFIAAASHDLRQPLHAMTLFHHALRHNTVNESNRRLFDSIDSSTSALNDMFDSLLDVSKLDANVVEPEYEPVKIQDVFALLEQEFRPIAAQKDLFFEVSGVDVSIYTDQTLFIRILRNLISNALKFTEHGGVTIDATLGDNHLTVSVSDSGVGIPEGEHERVFSEFYQLDSNQRHAEGGVGLGLSIVKRLSMLLGMKARLAQVQSGGIKASLTISCAELVDEVDDTMVQEISSSVSDPYALRGFMVVFIDDDDAIRCGMDVLLRQWGCRVVCTADEEQALSQLSELQLQPDLLIADYQLEGSRSGLDAIKILRTKYGEELPSIVVSGATSPDDLMNIKASDLAHLTKPVLPEKLHHAMLMLLTTIEKIEV